MSKVALWIGNATGSRVESCWGLVLHEVLETRGGAIN